MYAVTDFVEDENKVLQETSPISRINSKRAIPTILYIFYRVVYGNRSDADIVGSHSLQSLNSSEKRYHSSINNTINMTPSIQSNGSYELFNCCFTISNHSAKTPLIPTNSSSKTLKHVTFVVCSSSLDIKYSFIRYPIIYFQSQAIVFISFYPNL